MIRVAIQQRLFPAYRRAFFERLAASDCLTATLASGQPKATEGIVECSEPYPSFYTRVSNRYLLPGAASVVYQNGVVDWIEATDPDVLVVEANPRLISNRSLINWMHDRDRPVAGWGLGVIKHVGLRGLVQKPLYRSLMQSLDAAIGYGTSAKLAYQNLGLPANRTFVAKNAVSTVPDALPSLPSGVPPTLLFLGRITAPKGVERLIESCAQIGREEKLRLNVVGDGPERARCEKRAEQLGIDCRFYGHLTGEQLNSVILSSHILVMPGSGGLAIQEAIARGRPVVVGEADGTQADLVDSANGWLVDEKGLTETLRKALSERNNWQTLGRNSYQRARDGSDLNGMVSGFANAVCRIAELGVRYPSPDQGHCVETSS